MKFRKWVIILCTALILLSGCSTINHGFSKIGYQKIDDANKKIEQVQNAAAAQQQTLTDEINKQNGIIVQAYKDSLQGAANELFAANYAFNLDTKPNRLGVVVNLHVRGAQSYVRVAPTVESMQKTLVEVKTELDETKTSMADLQRKYDDTVTKADLIQNQKKAAEDQILVVQKEKADVESKKNADIAEIQKEKDAETKKVLDAQDADKQRLEQKLKDDKAWKALIAKLMIGTGLLSVGFLIAAIYAPLFKRESGIMASILGAVTIALPFIQPWMVGVIFGLVTVGVIGWLIIKHHKDINLKDVELKAKNEVLTLESRATKNITNAIQDVKEKSPEIFTNALQPALKEWNTVVTQSTDGTILKTVDTAVERLIDQKLIQSDRK